MKPTVGQSLRQIATALRAKPHLLPLGALCLVLFAGAVLLYDGTRPVTASQTSVVPIGGPFRLTGPDGQTVTEKSFAGKWMLVFFGYTFCPDVCPTTMIDIARALEALGPRADAVQPLLITVDPKRDTPAVLKDYTAHFDRRIIGLTGSEAAIADVQKAYRVYVAERPSKEGDIVLFDHSAIIYLMNPGGRYAAHFTSGMPGEDIAAGILKVLDEQKGGTG